MQSAETSDVMLRSVCGWRGDDAQRDHFDQLLSAARIGPVVRTVDEANLAVLGALQTQPMTSEELRAACEITKEQLGVAILRLRKQGHDINLVSYGRKFPRRFVLEGKS